MTLEGRCPDCGTVWAEARTCADDFHQMLYWENEKPSLGVAHHLMVLCYYLQHPALYSADGLRGACGLLEGFVVRGLTPEQVRARIRDQVDSGKRAYTITGRPNTRGAYRHPAVWTMTAADVVAGGADHYIDNVRLWAQSVYDTLHALGNLPPEG